ncbi:MAG TPA: FTR1 family protein [Acidimicrobiales bacterium]|nr:FTR1 family protein [Acidimicrobiales bacterium]
MIPTFVIFLREGIEAFTVVAILLAYLDRTGRRHHFRDVFAGVAAALVLVTGGGVAAYLLIHQYDGSRVQTIFETVTYVVAAAVLTYLTFWMQLHARGLSADLERRSDEALSRGARWGVGVLAFQAVGREGLETMVFTLAIVFASSSQAASGGHSRWLIVGALAGLVVAIGIAWWIYRLGHRLNVGRFFRVLGVVLMVFAAGLLADAVENLQRLGWLWSGRTLWNTSREVAESSSVGDVFHSLVGYADRPTVLQVAVWVGYVAISVAAFVRISQRQRRPKPLSSGDAVGAHPG